MKIRCRYIEPLPTTKKKKKKTNNKKTQTKKKRKKEKKEPDETGGAGCAWVVMELVNRDCRGVVSKSDRQEKLRQDSIEGSRELESMKAIANALRDEKKNGGPGCLSFGRQV